MKEGVNGLIALRKVNGSLFNWPVKLSIKTPPQVAR